MATTVQPITYKVNGIIYDEHDLPLKNVLVKVFDKDLRTEKLLGEKLTDAKGSYAISFKTEAPLNPEYKTADVFVKVFDTAGLLLGQSPVNFNVAEETTINYKIGNTPYKGVTEFDALLAIIEPIVKSSNVMLGDLQKNDKFDDFSFLAGETGEDAERIRLLNTAFAYSKTTIIVADIFYGLFRIGFPTVLNELLLIKADSIKKAIQQAINENIISSKWEKGIDKVIMAINELAVEKITAGNDEQALAFKKLFGSALLPKLQKTFVNTYFDNEDAPEKFWDKLNQQAGFNNATVEKTKQLLSLNLLTDNQPELAQQLFKKQTSDADLKDLRGFAKFSASDWAKQITTAGVTNFPAWVKGATTGEKTAHYAESLETLHKQLYPTTFFASRMKQDTDSVFSNKAQLTTFFNRNPTFVLNTKNINKQLDAAIFVDITDKEAVKKELKTINRLYKLTDDYKQVNALYGKNLFSATDVVRKYGKDQFVKQFTTITGSPDKAKQLFRNAVSINNKIDFILAGYKMRYDIPLHVMDGGQPAPKGYHEMFNDGELCECEHCQSVYSPVAYFVDMLSFIKGENEAAYNKLISRRPDLDDILLTCKNTNTSLPYIDLVNELLEKKVLALSAPTGVDPFSIENHSFQTEGLPAELIAIPEHVNHNAYNALKTVNGNAVFSQPLPLDFPLEELGLYTEKLGLKREELMVAFYGKNSPGIRNDVNLAAELFGFSNAELAIINGSNPFTVTLPHTEDGKCTIKDLLLKTKFTYIELLQLLETYFLNPIADGERRIKIIQVEERGEEHPLLTCNLDKLLLAGANNAWLNKAVRFVRLWKKLGWDIFDIDRTLTALGITDFPVAVTAFNEQLLIPFAHIEKTKSWLNLPIQQLVSFYTDIDTAVYIDHAKEGQPRIISLQDELFRGIVVNDVEALCAAFRISASDYADLEAGSDFSKSNLSKLYRQVLLAKALGISISDLKEVISITGNSTGVHVWTPEKLSEFLEQWKTFKSAGIKISEFKGCFNAAPDEEYTIPIDYILVKSVLDCINDLTAIQKNTTLKEEERKSYSVEKLLAFLQTLQNNTVLREALLASLFDPTDVAIKTVLENYLGDANKAILLSLPINEMINKLESLSKSFHDYTAVVLKKAPALIEKLKFDALEILWMKDNKETLGIEILWNESIDFNAITYKAFGQLYWLSVLAKIKNNTSVTWIDLMDLTIHNQLNTKANWFVKAVSLYKISEPSLEFLLGSKNDVNQKGKLNFSFPIDYNDAAHLVTIFDCCRMIENQGANPAQMNALLIADASAEHALSVLNLMKSKYDNKEWFDIIKPINDKLRNKRRDALVAWLLANTNGNKWNPANANDIYELLLIDTEMGSCMFTSRIKQAISSVQLYIDRCLMNLESGISLDDDFAKQWHTWRKQYRVWEANRKIFLYPENWIEPDLRDDKSPFFKELESQLKQNEVTEDTAKEALITYLQKLDTVANLEMVGLFNDEETNTVHVIGRTHNIPHQYFYRKQEINLWTAWEKVEVDIEGDHILPVVWNGRLILFWGLFTEKEERSGGFEVPGKGDIIEEPAKYWEMKLFWSECKNGKWGAKKLSNEQLRLFRKNIIHDHRNGSNKTHIVYLKKEDCSLTSSITNTGLSVNILLRRYGFVNRRSFYARFHFDFCHSFPVLKDIQTTLPSWYIQNASGTRIDLMTVSEWNKNNFNLFDKGVYRVDSPLNSDPIRNEVILNNTPGIFHLSTSHHAIWQEKPSDFFYRSNEKNFYVKALPSINHFLDLSAIKNPGVAIFRITAGIDEKDIDSGQSFENLREIRKSEANKFNSTDIPVIISSTDIAPHKDISVYKYRFENFYHPYICSYIKKLNTKSIDDLYRKNVQNRELKNIFTTTEYDPTSLVLYPYPKEEVDFSYAGSYSLYNWELFFHIPLLIATRLTQNQKFEEARKWFHYIFDPTSTSNEETEATRFWITKPFRNEIKQGIMPLEDLLNFEENADELEIQLSNWEQNPFNPHAVARLRISAYMRNTVLRYIDNLIQWGDQLFKRDTIESINEATLLYILASNILGKKQEPVPARAKPKEKSFSIILEEGGLDPYGNLKSEIETFISPSSGNDTILMPYFCLPKNDYLLKYWDTVSDRLFKIRHCMNIEGVARQLPLFEPPIDPALLVRATAAGLNLNEILNDMNVSLPIYRFQVMLQQANELCNDVKSQGNLLLSALEKKDGEELALLRSAHELRMLEMIKDVKEKQRVEVKENLNSLIALRLVIEERMIFYGTREYKNPSESQYYDSLDDAQKYLDLQSASSLLASMLHMGPNYTAGAWSWGLSIGGSFFGHSATAAGSVFGHLANEKSIAGNEANSKGSFDRRWDEWQFQSKSAELELRQIDKQIIAAEIRLAIAEKEIENHNLQMEQSREVDDYMRDKFTNAELYDWMVGQLSTVYFQSYQLAYSTAKKAEKCLQHELGLQTTNFVQFGYWDSLKKGLLSGEKLQYDLRKLENAYLEQNKREYEIVKHISISMLDPLALIKLRSTGSCDFEIPEVLYDMDHSGQFFRRLKSVSISLPCIAGPYTSVSAKLSLVNDRYRKNTNPNTAANTGFAEYPGNDDRFIYNVGAIQSIATSNAQNDSGVFELNFRDERYLPFEGCGAISKWKLELPSAIRQFDYNTISDVILHVKYTSREGGDVFKGLVEADLIKKLGLITQQLAETELHIALNLQHDLPDQLYVLKENGSVDLKIDKSRLPYFAQSLKANIKSVLFIVKCSTLPPSTVDSISMNLVLPVTTTNETITLSKVTEWGEMPQGQSILKSQNVNQIELDSAFKISIDKTQFETLDELIMLVKFNF